MSAMIAIMITPDNTACGAAPVAEMMASTGPPPNSELTASARPEYTVRWSTFNSAVPIPLVILPKAMLAPMVRQARESAPRMTERFTTGFSSLRRHIFSATVFSPNFCPASLAATLEMISEPTMV